MVNAVVEIPLGSRNKYEWLPALGQFIEVYKQLEGDDDATVHGWVSLEEAHDLIRKHTL